MTVYTIYIRTYIELVYTDVYDMYTIKRIFCILYSLLCMPYNHTYDHNIYYTCITGTSIFRSISSDGAAVGPLEGW